MFVFIHSDALDHVTMESVIAAENLPPFPASMKDGYAVLTKDGAGHRKVVGNSFAGTGVRTIQPFV